MLSLDAPMDRESGLIVVDGIADDDARRARAPAAQQRRSRHRCGMARGAQRAPANGDRAPLRTQRPRRGDARGARAASSASRASACARSRARRSKSCARKLEAARARPRRAALTVLTPPGSAGVPRAAASRAPAARRSRARACATQRASRSASARVDRAVAQHRERLADRRERDRELRPARRGARGDRRADPRGLPRQAGAREPRAQVVPQRERALLPPPPPHEPADERARPTRSTIGAPSDHDLPRRELVEPASRATASAAARS